MDDEALLQIEYHQFKYHNFIANDLITSFGRKVSINVPGILVP